MSKFSKVSKRGRKFLFAGKGMSVRTGRFLGESMLVGAVTGLVVVAFKYMIDCILRNTHAGITDSQHCIIFLATQIYCEVTSG